MEKCNSYCKNELCRLHRIGIKWWGFKVFFLSIILRNRILLNIEREKCQYDTIFIYFRQITTREFTYFTNVEISSLTISA